MSIYILIYIGSEDPKWSKFEEWYQVHQNKKNLPSENTNTNAEIRDGYIIDLVKNRLKRHKQREDEGEYRQPALEGEFGEPAHIPKLEEGIRLYESRRGVDTVNNVPSANSWDKDRMMRKWIKEDIDNIDNIDNMNNMNNMNNVNMRETPGKSEGDGYLPPHYEQYVAMTRDRILLQIMNKVKGMGMGTTLNYP